MKQKTKLEIDELGGSEDYVKQNSELKQIKNEISLLKQANDDIFQMIHEKGLEVGISHRIRDDLKELIGIINKIERVWETSEIQEKRKNLDNDIAKLVNKGDITSAFLKVSEELRTYREDMIGIRVFINLITFKLNHLENELTRQEK